MKNDVRNILKSIPPVNELLKAPELCSLFSRYGYSFVKSSVRIAIEGLRTDALATPESFPEAGRERLKSELLNRIKKTCAGREMTEMRRAVNATGTILHTGLGRSPLPASALNAIQKELKAYSLLSVDAQDNSRARRERFVAGIICGLTGAAAATVVNNNAAAALLCLTAFAKKKEVIVSRGQLVEIGGSFRLPEVLKQSGAKLVEVGTTNRTYIGDYENAVTEKTALILKVHASNFKITGFAQEPSIERLVRLGRKHGITVMDDIGSGALIDTSKFGIEREPMVRDSVKAGADIVCFSADKLIGGPQAGIILGRKKLIDELRRSPLFRALRVDKLTLVCLEATLKLFLQPEKLPERHPLYGILSADMETLDARAAKIAGLIGDSGKNFAVCVADGFSDIGGGALPLAQLPSRIVKVKSGCMSAERLARNLRMSEPPVFTRVKNDFVMLDARTVFDDEIEALRDVFANLSGYEG